MEPDDPLWKRILTSESFWTVLAAVLILGLAFRLAMSRG
jgi:hypothetical protein